MAGISLLFCGIFLSFCIFDGFAPGVAHFEQGGALGHFDGDVVAASVAEELAGHTVERTAAYYPDGDAALAAKLFGIDEPRGLNVGVGGMHEVLHVAFAHRAVVIAVALLLQEIDGQRGFGGELPAPVGVIRTVDENQVMDGRYQYMAAFTLAPGVAELVCHGDVMLDALLFEIGGYCKFFVVHRLQGKPYLFFFHVYRMFVLLIFVPFISEKLLAC